MPDGHLDAAAIKAATFIRQVEVHETLGSTNDRAAELAHDASIEIPALVFAHNQTAGRGRGTNRWSASEGALTFSVLLEPAAHGVSTAHWPQLSLTTGVAVCDALSGQLGPSQSRSLGIKWPNDIMIDGAKICGILIESPGGLAPAKDRIIIGIGINVNNTRRTILPVHDSTQRGAKLPNAISLFDITGRSHSLQDVLRDTLRALELRIAQLTTQDPQLPAAWQRNCWLTEQGIEVHSNGKLIEGVCLGIESDGTLLVENVDGTHRIRSGSVRLL